MKTKKHFFFSLALPFCKFLLPKGEFPTGEKIFLLRPLTESTNFGIRVPCGKRMFQSLL